MDAGARETLLAGLLERCLEGLEREGPSGVRAVLEEASSHGLAEDLRRQLGALQAAGLLLDEQDARVPERLGDFRLLKRLGGGGMGVVYLARQESLDRTVALKLIRPEHLYFPGARERFRREVDAVARLSHPGIVPIHTVGEEGGVPFFAMEHVRGATLAEVLAELAGRDPAELSGRDLEQALARVMARAEVPAGSDVRARLFDGSWVAACLTLVRQAAEALQHAHERGVLHRDIKPSNLVLAADGRVVLIDFGLAAAEGDARITRTGVQIGSLAYMSPEQFDGGKAAPDVRSDVYSLGVTLYELLTLRMPYEAGSVESLRQRVHAGRPELPRRLVPAVPRDAETVCLVAMEPDRRRRYASAAALAEDLSRVLELRPIAARRPGAPVRAWRFVQRHPARSAALFLGALLAVGGPVAYMVQQNAANTRIQAALDREEEQRKEAERQSAAAQANLARALEAVDTMLTRVGDETLRDTPQMLEVRRTLLQDALGFYEAFLAENEDDPFLAQQARHAAGRVGAVHNLLGEFEEAKTAFARGLALAEKELEKTPNDSVLVSAAAEALFGLHEVARFQGDPAEAERCLRRVVELRRAIVAANPGHADAMQSLAGVLDGLARLERQAGRAEESERLSREAMGLVSQALEEYPGNEVLYQASAQLSNNLGQLFAATGRLEEAREQYSHSLAMLRSLLADDPDSFSYASQLATGQSNLAALLGKLGRKEEAEALLRESVEKQESLLLSFPSDIFLRRSLALSLTKLAAAWQQAGRADEAAPFFRRSVLLLDELHTADPATLIYRSDLGVALNNLGWHLRMTGQPGEAVVVLRRGTGLQLDVVKQSPGVSEISTLRALHQHLGKAYNELALHEEAAATAEALLEALPGDAEAREFAATLLEGCAASAGEDVELADGYAARAAALRSLD